MPPSRPRFSTAFGQVLRRHRLKQGFSQEALAEKAEIDRTYVGLLERAKRAAGLDVAKKLAVALGVPLASLVAEAEKEWERGGLRPGGRAKS